MQIKPREEALRAFGFTVIWLCWALAAVPEPVLCTGDLSSKLVGCASVSWAYLPLGMRDPSSPTRDRAGVLCMARGFLTTGAPVSPLRTFQSI